MLKLPFSKGDNFIENHEFQFEKLGRLYRIPRHRSSKERRFKESISFVFVRHPFTRYGTKIPLQKTLRFRL